MTERQIQRHLFRDLRSSCEIAVPNYTPAGWFECDLFSVSKAGYFHEYEIKLTARDFRADATKREGDRFRQVEGQLVNIGGRMKHDLLAERCVRGPSRFWYIAPQGLIEEGELPAWAGFKVIVERGRYLRFETVKKAPTLHMEPVCRKVVDHARGVCYWRYWEERRRVDALSRRVNPG